ncbi:MAG TPA: Gfo/Idh/MocA family oxidoreductase [Chitinophagaceae bacterium]|nr:Gfo/Idh/MocA family oxidoreductase [Chitinophagaceae bacterium]
MRETNWGIIGPGNIAHDFARDLRLIPVLQQITAVMSHNNKSVDKFAREFNIPDSYTDFNEFLKNKTIDVVYIATPHPHHFKQSLACLENNIPVLCEKPMTINADQSQKLISAAQTHKTFLMEGMWIRFLPSIQQVLSIIKEGRIGHIVSIKASMCYKAPHDPNSRYFDPALGGGSLLDLGIYPVFLAHLLLGKPDTIKAVGTLSNEGVDEACSVLFHYKTGQQAILESSLLVQTDIPAEITGEKGIIKILDPWYEKSKGIELHEYNEEKIIYPCAWEGHGLQYEAQEVLNCIQQNKIESETLSHAFSLEMIKTMDEIRSQIHVTYDMYE